MFFNGIVGRLHICADSYYSFSVNLMSAFQISSCFNHLNSQHGNTSDWDDKDNWDD